MTDTIQRDEYLPDSPYPGINPFSYAHRNVFFAREAEVRALTRLIVMYRGVLLYSDSGTGKSSLINAGVIPLSMAEGFQPEMVRVQPKRDEEIIVERASEQVEGEPPFLPSIFTSDKELERVTLSVEDFLERLRDRAAGVYPLIIFDQFEEWVTLFEEDSTGQMAEEATTAQERIRDAIVSLVNDTELPVKVLIVFREDYLAKIDPLIEQCPSLRDQYLRLTPLSGDQIYRAIRGPFEKFPEEYRPELSDSLAKEILAQFGERSEGADVHLTEVQIVCQSLFEAGRRGDDINQYFSDEGGVQGILERYLEEALESLGEDQEEPAIGLLSRMVTSAGTRNVISRDDLLSRVENEDRIPRKLLSEALGNLDEKAKLVRRERRREVYYYEIVSEFLVGWIRRKAQEWQHLLEQREQERQHQRELEQAQQRTEEERRRANEQARYVRIFRCLTVALVIVGLMAIVAAVFAFRKSRETKQALQAMVAEQEKSEKLSMEFIDGIEPTKSDKVDMELIPAGEFRMGSNDGRNEEKPVHTVYLDAFYMDKYEVTNAQYKEFMDATGYPAPRYWGDSRYNAPDQPVVEVTWYDASAYAKWAGKRLPTEAEWEKAARGGLVGKEYPRGDELTRDDANIAGRGGKDKWRDGTSPVGSFPPNGYGLYDMAGNVWEWCADWYSGYPGSRQDNPTGPSSGQTRVVRGGSWRDPPEGLDVAYRYSWNPMSSRDCFGFRCVSQDSMVLIPAGEFQMGSYDGENDEKPVHTVYLDAFYMDKYEVTNAQYKEFMDATRYPAPRYWEDSRYNAPDQPVVGVTWYDASAYAKWAGKRLPTEAEWEKAARGGLVDRKKYPWGDILTHNDANYKGTGGRDIWNGPSPVGSFPPNGYGLYDMAGNVWEWCADWYDENYYKQSPSKNPKGPSSGTLRVLRGGASYDDPFVLRVAYRGYFNPAEADRVPFPGFRCVSQDSSVTP